MEMIPGSTSIPKAVLAHGYRFKCSTKHTGSEVWNTACSAQVGNRRAKTTFEWGV